ncbi:hypothetical protein C8R44DRAFT_930247 [Mycena epipterygia]|nr:hypothetical protein C8R44DRAFT_930247 [Mycena epipterygia]
MYGDCHYEERSSDPHFDDRSDDPAVFFDLLANNFHLDVDLRSDLHSFLNVARSLPPLQLRVALVQQTTMLSNQQVLLETKNLCATVQELASKIYKSLSANAKITKEQMVEITAACKAQFFTRRRFEFSNYDFRADVIPYLEKHADTNGLTMIFEDKTKAHHKLLVAKVGIAASNTKTWIRRTPSRGLSVSILATYLAKKCLGDSNRVKPQHAIWLIIIRFFIHHNKDLRLIISSDSAAVDDDKLEFPIGISTVPAKRTNNGVIITQDSDGKRIEAFWRQITVLLKARNKLYKSTDLQSEAGRSAFINECVREELQLFPSDPLTSIVGDKNASIVTTPPATSAGASTSNGGRLSGALRRPLTPSNTTSLPGFGGPRGPSLHVWTLEVELHLDAVHFWEFGVELNLLSDSLDVSVWERRSFIFRSYPPPLSSLSDGRH